MLRGSNDPRHIFQSFILLAFVLRPATSFHYYTHTPLNVCLTKATGTALPLTRS